MSRAMRRTVWLVALATSFIPAWADPPRLESGNYLLVSVLERLRTFDS